MTIIHTETLGKGKSIAMVHGWAMHSGIWRNFALELAKVFQVTLIDLPGHGRSEELYPFTLETISKALIDAVDIKSSCWLGWSLGAEIVLEIAHRYPDRVDKLIMLAGTPRFVQDGLWPGMDEKILDGFAESLLQDNQETLLRFLSLQIKGLADQKKALEELKASFFENGMPNQKTLQEGLVILKQADLRAQFESLKIPVAIILGRLDTFVPIAVNEKMQALLPEIDLTIIDKAGHVPFLSHHEAVIRAICRFMDN